MATTYKIMKHIGDLDAMFRSQQNTENGLAMSKYMKGHFQFYGLKSPLRNQIQKDWLKDLPHDLTHSEKWILIHELWKKEQREFQYVAMEYLNSWKPKTIMPEDIDQLKFLITHKAWWDTVDLLASNFLGNYCLKFPEEGYRTIQEWRNSENMWLNRSCLLFQLKYKEKTDVELLKSLIRQYQPVKKFFIQKAIGWTLRQYSKTNPETVRAFVNEIGLKGLAAKEATKYL
jgi:3-methyladenine DNA glycosylase AlkD